MRCYALLLANQSRGFSVTQNISLKPILVQPESRDMTVSIPFVLAAATGSALVNRRQTGTRWILAQLFRTRRLGIDWAGEDIVGDS